MAQTTVDEIISLFFTVGRRLRQQGSSKAEGFSLNLQQLETLRYITEHGQTSMKDVAAFACISPPSATSLVKQLVDLKVIKREYDKNSRRNIYLALTKKGHSLLTQLLHAKCENFTNLLKNLNKQEQLTMLRLLQKMTLTHE